MSGAAIIKILFCLKSKDLPVEVDSPFNGGITLQRPAGGHNLAPQFDNRSRLWEAGHKNDRPKSNRVRPLPNLQMRSIVPPQLRRWPITCYLFL